MTEIHLEPDLSNCIQTLTKKQHARMIRELLKSKEQDTGLEQKAEMLRIFLESTNFRELRSEYEPFLIKGKKVRFTLRPGTGKTDYPVEIIW